MTRLVYLIGYPGAGKSTTALAALGAWTRHPIGGRLPHALLMDGTGHVAGASLGRDREPFGGTDTLSMSIQPRALEWLAGVDVPFVFGEGDRLANASFFRAARQLMPVTVVALRIGADEAAARRATRRAAYGTKAQNPTWVKGRQTKVDGLTADVELDATQRPALLGAQLRHILTGRGPT